jgi:hypothetical protein
MVSNMSSVLYDSDSTITINFFQPLVDVMVPYRYTVNNQTLRKCNAFLHFPAYWSIKKFPD